MENMLENIKITEDFSVYRGYDEENELYSFALIYRPWTGEETRINTGVDLLKLLGAKKPKDLIISLLRGHYEGIPIYNYFDILNRDIVMIDDTEDREEGIEYFKEVLSKATALLQSQKL